MRHSLTDRQSLEQRESELNELKQEYRLNYSREVYKWKKKVTELETEQRNFSQHMTEQRNISQQPNFLNTQALAYSKKLSEEKEMKKFKNQAKTLEQCLQARNSRIRDQIDLIQKYKNKYGDITNDFDRTQSGQQHQYAGTKRTHENQSEQKFGW